MQKISKKTLINMVFMFALTGLFDFCLFNVWDTMNVIWAVSLLILSIIVLASGLIAKLKGFDSIYKIAIICVYVGAIMIIIYSIMVFTGFLERFENYDELKSIINSSNGKSEVIFVIAQFLQVTFIPIPSNIVVLAGDELFGPVKAFFLSIIGLMIGSMFAFFLGKTFGLKLVTWIAGKEAIDKYQQIVKGRDKTLLVLMFLFPMFPDDLLCMIAGLTSMSYLSFFIVMLISRPLSVGGTILFKRGLFNIIPFSGWGIPLWIIIIIFFVWLFIYTFKNGDKIEIFMLRLIGKITKKDYVQQLYPVKMGDVPIDKNIPEDVKIKLQKSQSTAYKSDSTESK